MPAIKPTTKESKVTRVPCALCGKPSTGTVWDAHLCDACTARWHAESPMPQPLELAHAEAHPEDVEGRGTRTYPAAGEDPRWVLLKPGVSGRLARRAAVSWLMEQQAARRSA